MEDQNSRLRFLQLQVVVLALGEAHHAGWWKSQFLSPVGLSHLSYVYPRSNFAAAVRSASRAAKIVHDSSIGIGQVFHLFRLPREFERHLDETLRESEADLHAQLEPFLSQRERLLERLEQLSETTLGKAAVGPLRMGTMRDLHKPNSVARLASAYYAAFRDGVKVFPYFEDDKKSR